MRNSIARASRRNALNHVNLSVLPDVGDPWPESGPAGGHVMARRLSCLMCRRRRKVSAVMIEPNGVLPEVGEGGESVELARQSEAESSSCWLREYFLLCLLVAGLPCAASVVLWSDLGFGQEVYTYFFGGTEHGAIYAGLAVLLLLCLYLLDFFWPPHLEGQYFVLCDKDMFVGRAIVGIAGMLLFAAALNLAETYPAVPIQCTVLLGPLLTTVVRALTRPLPEEPEPVFNQVGHVHSMRMLKMQRYVGSERDATAFYAGSMTAFFLLGILTLAVWLVWALNENIDFSDITFGDAESARTPSSQLHVATRVYINLPVPAC
ncbi:unnamed protein product [Symbiodinium sp. CCMP2592]|nr:unnamed protein product [Symbiodinium sp. CCMP2592]